MERATAEREARIHKGVICATGRAVSIVLFSVVLLAASAGGQANATSTGAPPPPSSSITSTTEASSEQGQSSDHTTDPWPGDWSQLLPNIVATALGAGLGFLIALGVYRLQSRDERKKQEHERSQRRSFVLRVIRDEIALNIRQLNQIVTDLQGSTWTSVAPVSDTWADLSVELRGAIQSAQTESVIKNGYLLLDQVERLLGSYTADINAGGERIATARAEKKPDLENLVTRTLEALHEAERALAALDH